MWTKIDENQLIFVLSRRIRNKPLNESLGRYKLGQAALDRRCFNRHRVFAVFYIREQKKDSYS